MKSNEEEVWNDLSNFEASEIASRNAPKSNILSTIHHQLSSIKTKFNNYNNYSNNNDNVTDSLSDFGINASLLQNDFNMNSKIELNDEDGGTKSNNNQFMFINSNLPKSNIYAPTNNLDIFLKGVYSYYYYRGFTSCVCGEVVDLCVLCLTYAISVFLFLFVNWTQLLSCKSEDTCLPHLSEYLISLNLRFSSIWGLVVLCYCFVVGGYTLLASVQFVTKLREAYDMKYFFENALGISERQLQGGAVEWDDIVNRIIGLQTRGEYRIAVNSTDLTALSIAQRIMRKDNYMIAFFNLGLLNLSIPALPENKMQYLSNIMEWSIHYCIFGHMFNHKFQIRPSFLDPISLQRRFLICGVLQALFMPFLFLFMILHFLLVNMYDLRTTKDYMGPRRWTNISKWMFREFNELPHAFERRLEPSYEAADKYLSLFSPNIIVVSIGRLIVFASGSLLAVLFLFAAVDDSILLHVKIRRWNLLWYVGVLGVLFGAGKSLLPSPERKNRPQINGHKNYFAEMNEALYRVTTHTHYHPDIWKNRAWKTRTYKEFSAMFPYKSQLFLIEVLSLVFGPMVLAISLPKCADSILHLIQRTKINTSFGDVCGFSCFDFDMFCDENWSGNFQEKDQNVSNTNNGHIGCATLPVSDVLGTSNVIRSTIPKTRLGKLEKSLVGFKAAHPSWKASLSGENVINRIESYHLAQQNLLARERELHIQVASRLLEELISDQAEQKSLNNTLSYSMGAIKEETSEGYNGTEQSVPGRVSTENLLNSIASLRTLALTDTYSSTSIQEEAYKKLERYHSRAGKGGA